MAALGGLLKTSTSGQTKTSSAYDRNGKKIGIPLSLPSATWGKTFIDPATARRDSANRMRQYNKNAITENQGKTNFSDFKTAYYGNSNPMSRSGTANLNAYGRQFAVPNAFAQQMTFRAGVNAGRWGLSELLKRESGEEVKRMPYASYDVMQQQAANYTNKFNERYQRLRGDVQSEMMEARKEYERLSKPYIAKEMVGANGQISGNNTLERQARLEEIKKKMNLLSREDLMMRRGNRGEVGHWEELEAILKRGPTRSNLPIKETVIFN